MSKDKKKSNILQSQTSKYAAYRKDEEKDKKQKPKNFFKTAARLLSLLKGNIPTMVIVIICCAIGAFLTVLGPQYLGNIMDLIKVEIDKKLTIGTMDFSAIVNILLTIAAIYFGSSVFTFFSHFLTAGITQKLITKLRHQLNEKLSVLPLSFFDGHNKGDLLSRVTNDIDNINNTFQHNIINLVNSIVTFVGVLGIMLYNNRFLTMISVSPLPFGLIAASLILTQSKKYFRRHWEVMGDVNGHIEEMFTGHSIVKVFGHEKRATEEFKAINNNLYSLGLRAQFLSGILPPVINFANDLAFVFICILGGKLIIDGKASIGAITIFISYSRLLMQPLIDVANILNQIQSSLSSAERVFDVLDAQEQVPETVNAEITEPKGAVKLENVNFSYTPDKPLIENFNLDVKPGQLIAIVGPTGAGKTTIVNLLMRFYEVNSGSISVDGINITDLSRHNLHDIFGMVLQDTWLFKGTIRENLVYGSFDKTDEEVIAACKMARVHDFIMTLPNGYDTKIDEDGSNLSQGQKQLLTIARMFLSDPYILILDEATSSVDTRTESQISEAMASLMSGRTNFVIAHRLSTIRNADNIIFVRDGRITEQGTHNQLLEKNGDYAELYQSQFRNY